MHYVYILQSTSHPDRFYTGATKDINRRLAEHNRHAEEYSSRYKPWELKTYVAFNSKVQAIFF